MKSNPYLQLIRPANLITSATDVFAGACLSTFLVTQTDIDGLVTPNFIYLTLASIFLYAGGIAFNDVLDHKTDQIERPERPIPSGRISVVRASAYAGVLLVIGILLAWLNSSSSGLLAFSIALLSLVYNIWAKHHPFAGPLNMGILRGLNLLLGLSLLPGILPVFFGVAIVPVIYIFAITMVSRGEVHGSTRNPLYFALILFLLADMGVLAFGAKHNRIWPPVAFTLSHLLYILPPLWAAIKEPTPGHIRKTVIHGVLGIILLDAIWVSTTDYWILGFALLVLLPLSQKLGRYFSVT